jgi:CubicO group peptidase (beta-lactamase class C family)
MKSSIRIRSAALGLLVCCLSLQAVGAETPDYAAQIDELFASWDAKAPGAAVAVIKDGEIVYSKGIGMADLERGVPITTESVFEIGSISKQFTAMSILLLENDGKLSLDDDIRKHVPEMPEYERPITLRHLMHHISGVRDIETLVPLAGMHWFNYFTDEQMLELITRQKVLNFSPGEQHLYSNSGYVLLMQVVERVSGMPLREFAQERIFGPLGMNHSVFWDHPGQVVPNRALSYEREGEDGWKLAMWNMAFHGPAGLYTTVGDLALWDANFYDNKLGGGAALIEKMETPGLLNDGESTNYAGGLVVRTQGGLPIITHSGAWMGYRAGMRRFPDQRFSVVVLGNSDALRLGAGQIANIYLADEFESSEEEDEAPAYEPPATIELSADRLVAYEGTYWNDSESLLRIIEVRNGKLHYSRGGDNASELAAQEAGRFFMVGLEFHVGVDFEGAGAERAMTVSVGEQEPLLFEPLPPSSEAVLAPYAGAYWSDELQRELRVSIDGDEIIASWADEETSTAGRLVRSDDLLLPRFVPVPWYPQDTRLRFARDGDNAVTGLSLTCDMVRGVEFTRLP